MISCLCNYQEKFIKKITIKGHANFSEHGKDIVCAGVSTLAFTVANKLFEINSDYLVNINDNEIIFESNGFENNEQLLLETLIDGLKMLEQNYSDCIKIEEV